MELFWRSRRQNECGGVLGKEMSNIIGDWDYIWCENIYSLHFCPWKPQNGSFGAFKARIGEKCMFYIELVSVTYGNII